MLGLFLSLILLQIIATRFNLLGLSSQLTQAIWGATMILAIAIALLRDRFMAHLRYGKHLSDMTGDCSRLPNKVCGHPCLRWLTPTFYSPAPKKVIP